MSRESTKKLAKAAWIVPLVWLFGNRFAALVIGRSVADFLVFVLAVVAIPVAVYCLVQVRLYGARGILNHAVAALVIGTLLLAIWIPNFLAARGRSIRTDESRQVVNVHVTRDGTIRMNGVVVTLDTLKQELRRASAGSGTMRYSREDASAEPHPNAMAVMKAATETNITIQMVAPDEP